MFLHAQQLQATVRIDRLSVKSTELAAPALIQHRQFVASTSLGRRLGQLACPDKPATAQMPQL